MIRKYALLVFILLSLCFNYSIANSFDDGNYYSFHLPYFDEADSLEDIRNVKINSAVNIITTVNKKIDEECAFKLATLIYEESKLANLPYSLLLAIIETESRFNHNAKSWAGAKGIMQLMPGTFKSVSRQYGYNYSTSEIYDLRKNLRIGTLYLLKLYERFDNDEIAAAGYNGGLGVALKYAKYTQGNISVRIPRETKNYVMKVSLLKRKYKQILKED